MFTYIPTILCAAAQGADGTAAKGNPIWTIVMMVALFAVMYFVMIRPQRKRQKEEQTMRDSIQIGDEITTIGGIMGRVVTVKDDSIVLESGSDRVKMKFTRWAIQTNNTAQERAEKERAALKAAQEAEKEEKRAAKGRKERKKKEDEE